MSAVTFIRLTLVDTTPVRELSSAGADAGPKEES
jgi:hypothetical protein